MRFGETMPKQQAHKVRIRATAQVRFFAELDLEHIDYEGLRRSLAHTADLCPDDLGLSYRHDAQSDEIDPSDLYVEVLEDGEWRYVQPLKDDEE